MNKKRILLVNEASYLNTGYANYGLEVMRRLFLTKKYELAELACYVGQEDERNSSIPWKFYPNLPSTSEERGRYQQYSEHEFGAFRFEEVCLDFKPDMVWSIRDTWMDSHIIKSWFRKFFHYTYMPTVDATPQQDGWIDQFMQANAIFTYTDWSMNLLKKQTNNKICVISAASPGISVNELPLVQDKAGLRKTIGIPVDAFIIGTVMRNQKRKLYPNLIEAFKELLTTISPEQQKKTFLYFHVSYPDLGWDIPRLIKDSGISNKIYFTYVCKACKRWFCSKWQDARSICVHCQNPAAVTPNTQYGLSRIDMHHMYSLFDLYVQYANSEGFGMPQVDAAAAGIPICSVNYSAMEDVVKKLDGIAINVKHLIREPETNCLRATPDDSDFANKVKRFMFLPESIRKTKGIKTRKLVEKHFSWDNTAKIWEKHFDSIDVKSHDITWNSPVRFHYQNLQCAQNLNNEQFVQWALTNIAGRPDLINTYFALQMVRDLNWTATLDMNGPHYLGENSLFGNIKKLKDFNRNTVVEICTNMCNHRNYWEQRREQCVLSQL
jgi:glycosyltransferase involved in cell wall biosynthesis